MKVVKAVGLAAVGAGAAAFWSMVGARVRIELERTTITCQLPPTCTAGLRILHLTDLHISPHSWVQSKKWQRTLHLLHGETFDLVCITGDFIDSDADVDQMIAFVRSLPQGRLGTFGCLGNHDYAVYSLPGVVVQAFQTGGWRAAVDKAVSLAQAIVTDTPLRLGVRRNDVARLTAALADAGVTVLTNEGKAIADGVWLAGVDDLMEGVVDCETVGVRPKNHLSILLAHHPDTLQDPTLHNYDVALCGHVHGGQIRLPLVGPLYTQGAKTLDKRASGWYQYGNTRAYVSRGWGESTPIRINCPPEITIVEINNVQ